MSCYYKALPRLIPELILLAGRGAEISFVSPWVDNVVLLPPRFGTGEEAYTNSNIQLREFLLRITRDFDMRVVLLIRDRDRRLRSALGNIQNTSPDKILIKDYPYIHAKMIVTPRFVLETSANILQTSLFRNIESCTLIRNSFGSTRRYLRNKLGIII